MNSAINGGKNWTYIDAGSGDDTIVGFDGNGQNSTSDDTSGPIEVNGEDGIDTLVLEATSADLNNAHDGDLYNVEIVSAAGAAT